MSDGKVDIPLELEDDLLFDLMLEAHKRDITLNQMVELILTEEIKRIEQEKLEQTSNPC